MLGGAAVLLHDVKFPFGVALALIGSGTGIWMLGRSLGKKRYKFAAILGWIGIVFNASAPGVGNELLVQGNTSGNFLVLGGFISLVLAFFLATGIAFGSTKRFSVNVKISHDCTNALGVFFCPIPITKRPSSRILFAKPV